MNGPAPPPGDFQAWNQCLNHILALANAHVESVTYAAFARAVESCIDPDCRRWAGWLGPVGALGFEVGFGLPGAGRGLW